jgi:hypothetical protein
MLFPGRYSRGVELRLKGRSSVQIMVGIVPVLLVAAAIEAFVSAKRGRIQFGAGGRAGNSRSDRIVWNPVASWMERNRVSSRSFLLSLNPSTIASWSIARASSAYRLG